MERKRLSSVEDMRKKTGLIVLIQNHKSQIKERFTNMLSTTII